MRRLFLAFSLTAALFATTALGQEEAAPAEAPAAEAPPKETPKPAVAKPAPKPEAEGEGSTEAALPVKEAPARAPDRKKPLTPDEQAAERARLRTQAEKEAPPPPPKPVVKEIAVRKIGKVDFDAAWGTWRRAVEKQDTKAEASARADLLKLKAESGADGFETYAASLIRSARMANERNDPAGAVDTALAAVELAPKLPTARLALAEIYLGADPSDLGRVFDALGPAMQSALEDPRFSRALYANIAVCGATALVLLATVVLLVLFFRRSRYFYYDFHFFFPRALARWQTTMLASLILLLPWVFRTGLVPGLLAFFLAASLYSTLVERIWGATLIVAVAALPLLMASVVERTVFAGTEAEVLHAIELGGPEAEAIAQEFQSRAKDDQLNDAELMALGRFELRRGQLDQAVSHLKRALLRHPQDARATTNLATAMFLANDIENPKSLYEEAMQQDPTLGVPAYNASLLYRRRVKLLGQSAAIEVDKASSLHIEAINRDPSLGGRAEPNIDELRANVDVLTVPLSMAEILAAARGVEAAARVEAQVASWMFGGTEGLLGLIVTGVFALLVVGLGGLAGPLGASKPCTKCGRPVSRRGDPELPRGSLACGQCVNVYGKPGVIPAATRVRKQVEVARFQAQTTRLRYSLGVLYAGMGHVFAGMTTRGIFYGFFFSLVIAAVIFRDGAVRVPFEAPASWLIIAPPLLVAFPLYVLAIRGLRKRPVSGE